MMRSDLLKTIAGLVIIGLIVLATFLYGSAQREAQQKRDQELKQAQQTQTSPSPVAANGATPTATPKPTATPTSAPTKSPAASPTPLPQTGTGMVTMLAIGSMGLAALAWRRSRRAVVEASRMRRND